MGSSEVSTTTGSGQLQSRGWKGFTPDHDSWEPETHLLTLRTHRGILLDSSDRSQRNSCHANVVKPGFFSGQPIIFLLLIVGTSSCGGGDHCHVLLSFFLFPSFPHFPLVSYLYLFIPYYILLYAPGIAHYLSLSFPNFSLFLLFYFVLYVFICVHTAPSSIYSAVR